MNIENYKLIREEQITEMKGMGYLLEHIKTKARIFVISNDDTNKVFTIGFRTPPVDDTGLPHILEHSVLCGSKNYPVKDPFIELAKGSLNTFLNAMTYPDKTVYPVASYNDKDFKNLMNVYLDAVFYPNIYQKEEIFKQEGWHYELESEEDELIYNGVVYNEMKGVYSSPEQLLMRAIQKSLLKDTTYGYESGGDPECITHLTYDQFLDFHKKYYHPSNSYIYLYGDMNIEENLSFIHDEYLSKFDYLDIDSSINMQEAFTCPTEIEDFYSLSDNEEEEDNVYLSYNCVVGTSLEKELYLAFQIIDYVLIDVPGAPLKEALIDANIGKDVFSSYDNGILQPIYSIITKSANESDKEQFIKIIRKTLEDLVAQGINKRSLKAAINHFEFKYKEANFGRYPKGLMYGLQAFDSWLYDDFEPFMHIMANDTFEFLKQKISTNYYEDLIKTYLLDNQHRSILMLKPKKGLNSVIDETEKNNLLKYRETLSKEEIGNIIQQNSDLKEYQTLPSTKEELESIPLLEIEDIQKKSREINNVIGSLGEITTVCHPIFTNGIGYVNLSFDISELPFELNAYLSLLTAVFRYVDTENYTYNELSNEINIETGGISFSLHSMFSRDSANGYMPIFEIKTKALYNNIATALSLIEEIIFTSKIDDYKRLREIIGEIKSQVKMGLSSQGHVTAANRALSYISPGAYFKETIEGISFYEFIDVLDKEFDNKKEEIGVGLKTAIEHILRRDKLTISYTGDNLLDEYKESLNHFVSRLSTGIILDKPTVEPLNKKSEGFKTASKVQYVATAGNFIDQGFSYDGSMKVMQVIFSYDYLWQNVRVLGGAYGSMCSFARTGESYFTSYRDPNLMETYSIYQRAGEYLENFQADERDILKYIIGAISKIDTPMNPSAEGEFSFDAYLLGITTEQLQKERDELLGTTRDKIRSFAPLVKAITNSNILCVIGDETKIEGNRDNFQEVLSVF